MHTKIGEIIYDRYRVVSIIGQDGIGKRYRVQNVLSGEEYLLKCLYPAVTSSYLEDSIRLHREIEQIKKLSHPSLIPVIADEKHNDIICFVSQSVEGTLLSSLLQSEGFFSITRSIDIILQILRGLFHLHQSYIFHQDVRPENILVSDSKEGSVARLLDAGLVHVVELSGIKDRRVFAYMSPERSGMIKKMIDDRSDLYSLGVLFYRLLAGRLPFDADNINGVLHQQITQIPESLMLFQSDIPSVLDKIVQKLLSQDPVERYQTAKALINDLNFVQEGKPVTILGHIDQKEKLTYQTSLVGRTNELNELKQLYDQAASGSGRVCFVAGEAGMGKTRLAHELQSYVYRQGGEFVFGKCFSKSHRIPYAPFQEAMSAFIKNLEMLDEDKKNRYIARMVESVGELGELVCRFIPAIKNIFVNPPDVITLEGQREQKRFLSVCTEFLLKLGDNDRPLVIHLDDLQWGDEGTMFLLEDLIKKIEDTHIFILVTYRHNEVSERHRLSSLLRCHHCSSVGYMKLLNFTLSEMSDFIGKLLGTHIKDVTLLTEYVYKKGQGNPLFTLEIIRHLVNRKIVSLVENQWQLRESVFDDSDVPDTMLDILLKRLESLGNEQVELLSIASVIGRKFEIKLLYDLTPQPRDQVVQIVDEVIALQLLETTHDRQQLVFVHDRIRDAFYEKIVPVLRKDLHLKIAIAFEQRLAEMSEEKGVLFDLVYHYYEAEKDQKVIQYALPAARYAKSNYAYNDALRYYEIYFSVIEKSTPHSLHAWTAAKLETVDILVRMGKSNEAILRCNELLPLINDRPLKVNLYEQMGAAYFKKGDWVKCEQNLKRGLNLLGVYLPTKRYDVYIDFFRQIVLRFLISIGHPIAPLFRSEKRICNYQKGFSFLMVLLWAYILSDGIKFTLFVIKAMNIAVWRIGVSKELGKGYSFYGSLFSAVGFFNKGNRLLEKAIHYHTLFADQWGIAKTLQNMGYCYKWQGDYTSSIDFFIKANQRFERIGDLWEISMVYHGFAHVYRYQGDYQLALFYEEKHLKESENSNNRYGQCEALACMSYCYVEMGDFDKAEIFGKRSIEISRSNTILFALCFSLEHYGYFCLESGEYDEAISYLEEARVIDEQNRFIKDYTCYIYPYLIEAYVEKFLSEGGEVKNLNALCRKTLNQGRRWPNHACSSFRSAARYFAIKKKTKTAEKYFLKAIDSAERIGRQFELAKNYYFYSIFLENAGRMPEVKGYLQKAYTIFQRINARAYIEKCARQLPQEDIYPDFEEGMENTQERLRIDRRMETALEVSQYLSSILDRHELSDKIIDKAMELVGAKRGFLLLYQNEKDEEKKFYAEACRNIPDDEWQKNKVIKKILDEVCSQKTPKIIASARRLSGQLKVSEQSIFCLPILNRSELIGIIYLDNPMVADLFKEEDVKVLGLIAAQAGVSIQNALLYQKVEKHAENLSRLVEDKTKELKNTQQQLVRLAHDMGKAEVSTGVVHNIGNAMTPLSAKMSGLADKISKEEFLFVTHISSFLAYIKKYQEQNGTLDFFLSQDEKGKKFVKFLEMMSMYLKEEKLFLQKDIDIMFKNLQHIDESVRIQIEQVDMSEEDQLINLKTFINDALLMQEQSIEERNIQIENIYNGNAIIKINRAKFMQVLQNLIKNAYESIDQMKNGDEKKISISVKIVNKNQKKIVCIQISDTGVGLDIDKEGDKLFKAGYTTKKHGTGVGLYFCQQFITSKDGEINCISEGKNKGASFEILLPIADS